VRPNAGPGKPVKPQVDEIVDKWVDFQYPSDRGIQQRLEAAGYTVKWCSEDKLSRKIDLEGCEVVVGPDAQGVRSKFRHKDRPNDQTLIKTKVTSKKEDRQVRNGAPPH
jgi:hypothetical protein